LRGDGTIALETSFVLAKNDYKDFLGSIQQRSFRLWKRRKAIDLKGVPELYGKKAAEVLTSTTNRHSVSLQRMTGH
jgi:hypothetical protein